LVVLNICIVAVDHLDDLNSSLGLGCVNNRVVHAIRMQAALDLIGLEWVPTQDIRLEQRPIVNKGEDIFGVLITLQLKWLETREEIA